MGNIKWQMRRKGETLCVKHSNDASSYEVQVPMESLSGKGWEKPKGRGWVGKGVLWQSSELVKRVLKWTVLGT